MPAMRPDDLLAYLDARGIAATTHRHRPIFTVEEGRDLQAALPGAHTKNLFVKDKKGALWLICAAAETRIDLNALAKALGAGRMSFGAADLMDEALGVAPGSVTIFALVNDPGHRVRLVLDEALAQADRVNFHPLTNEATTAIAGPDLFRFLAATGHAAIRIAFGADGRPRLIEPAR